LDKIFVPFHTTKTQGTGLGLPICRQLIEQHGGRIEVASRLGNGTVFTIELPAQQGLETKFSEV
jgi:signal transduction histidine kinase